MNADHLDKVRTADGQEGTIISITRINGAARPTASVLLADGRRVSRKLDTLTVTEKYEPKPVGDPFAKFRKGAA